MMTAREITELVLKFEDLKEQQSLYYIIQAKITKNNGEDYLQLYEIQRLEQLGELLRNMEHYDWEVTITHITAQVGIKE